MTHQQPEIAELKTAFIAALESEQRDFTLLTSMLTMLSENKPELFQIHQEGGLVDPINQDRIDWNSQYFNLQKNSLKENFSLERASHLVDVCQFLSERGDVGFVVKKEPSLEQVKAVSKLDHNFIPTQNLSSAIESGSVYQIRAVLLAELENNRHLQQEIQQMMLWAQKNVANLFVPYEEDSLARPLETDKLKWDTDCYYLHCAYLNSNFSQARFEHLVEMYQYLREKNTERFIYQPVIKPQAQTSSAGQKTSNTVYQTSSSPLARTEKARPPVLSLAVKIGGAIAVLALAIIALL